MTSLPRSFERRAAQRGVSLIVVLLILVIVSILGAGGAQIAMMAERGARNDRDMQVAWQAAEAALMDAEFDIHGPNTSTAKRRTAVFTDMHDTNAFLVGCGSSSTNKGLCALAETGQPAWLAVDLTASGSSAKSVAFGDFTGRVFNASVPGTPVGAQPAQVPRYVIEPIRDPAERNLSVTAPLKYVYRVTAMGFGPRPEIRAVSQIIYRD
ncbi:MAG: pilus assembly PilX family protein [Janthinobacterium lividum]